MNATFRPLYLQERDAVPIYRRLGGPQGRCGRVRKISPLPGFETPNRPVRGESNVFKDLHNLKEFIQPQNFCYFVNIVVTS